jgi:HEAT repeat protein
LSRLAVSDILERDPEAKAMPRPFTLFGLALLSLIVPAVRADDDDPVFQRRKLSEWVELLRGDRDLKSRQTALLALGASGSTPRTWEPLTRLRNAGLIAVELIGPEKGRQVIPALALALREDPDERIREGAAGALGRIFTKVKAERYQIPAARLDTARDALATALRSDRSPRVREAAAFALGQQSGDVGGVVAALAGALKDEHPGPRSKAADALRRLGREARAALPELRHAVRDPANDRLTRIQAALAIGRIGPPEAVVAVSDLAAVLADTKTPAVVRTAAAEGLSSFGQDAAEAVPVLAAILTSADADTEVRRAAATALDQIGPAARPALAALVKAFKDSDKFVRCQALHAVGRLGKELGSDSRGAITAILVSLNDSVVEVRVAAIEALGNLGQEALGADAKAVTDRLLEATKDGQRPIREAAADALKKLRGSPGSEN